MSEFVRSSNRGNSSGGILMALAVLIVVVVIGFVLFSGSPVFGYMLHYVNTDEVGVKIQNGEVKEIVGPGSYSDPFSWFSDIINVKVSGLPFSASDDDVLVKEAAQTIGVQVSGTVFRPRDAETLINKWALYGVYYRDEGLLQEAVETQARQAIKVCVGDRTFEQAAVGTNRDDLGNCIDTTMDRLLANFGLVVENVVVPDIAISDRARERINAITDAQNQAEQAVAESTRVYAEGQRDLAEQQVIIQITQGANQELLRQQATSSAIELTVIAADRQVLEAELSNEKLAAQRREEIQGIQLEIDRLIAQSETVEEEELARIINSYPRYAQYLRDQLTAQALQNARLVYLTTGTNPLQIIGDTDDVMLNMDVPGLLTVTPPAPGQ